MRSARLFAIVAAALLVAPAARGEEDRLVVDPPELSIGLFFHGADLRVRVARPEGDRAVFRLAGPGRDVRLKVKDRIGGVLWASVGEVTFEDVPSLLLVTGEPDLPPEPVLTEAGLSPESLRSRILGPDPSAMESLAFEEMLRLFTKRGTWAAGSGGGGAADAVFHLPPDMPTGEFDVGVTFFAGERVIGEEHAKLTVRRTGFVSGVTRLAEHHGFWYGMIAIVIATLAGLATGYLFGLRRKQKG
jgi:hypothetical protein